MKLAIFGLTLSSSWGNGHATLWRGLIRALGRSGHDVVFFERDVPYYAEHRDLCALPGAELILYPRWDDIRQRACAHIADADAVIITSYCPDAREAARLLRDESATALRVFYDLDTPVTLARLGAGETVEYVPEDGLGAFDLVLSYTGGIALAELQRRLGARRVAPLHGHADPETHAPRPGRARHEWDLSYLGTFAADRQRALEQLFIEPARRSPHRRFVLGGSGYPASFPWCRNIWFLRHVPPPDHPAFFCSSRLTLNVTRGDMAAMGFCPSGRLFEAAACGTPLITDDWHGLEHFYAPGAEILVAHGPADVIAALERSDEELQRIARAARERTLAEHSSAQRASELVALLEDLSHVGHHPGGRQRHAHSASRLLEGAAAGRPS
ncbi:MAG TPA: glycosyltransferase [Steroidobacteraceae bacterium]|nr:glycosyltransferase [Steroidobacteraceae bacterium]